MVGRVVVVLWGKDGWWWWWGGRWWGDVVDGVWVDGGRGRDLAAGVGAGFLARRRHGGRWGGCGAGEDDGLVGAVKVELRHVASVGDVARAGGGLPAAAAAGGRGAAAAVAGVFERGRGRHGGGQGAVGAGPAEVIVRFDDGVHGRHGVVADLARRVGGGAFGGGLVVKGTVGAGAAEVGGAFDDGLAGDDGFVAEAAGGGREGAGVRSFRDGGAGGVGGALGAEMQVDFGVLRGGGGGSLAELAGLGRSGVAT